MSIAGKISFFKTRILDNIIKKQSIQARKALLLLIFTVEKGLSFWKEEQWMIRIAVFVKNELMRIAPVIC